MIAFAGILVFLIITIFAIRYRQRIEGRPDRSARLEPLDGRALDRDSPGPLPRSVRLLDRGLLTSSTTRRPTRSEIYVVGKQWMWYLQHPEGKREINELHLPVGRAVKLRMTSQDVIHSFFVPAFRVKQDVLPGRYTEMWFRPTKVGQVITCSALSIAARTTR